MAKKKSSLQSTSASTKSTNSSTSYSTATSKLSRSYDIESTVDMMGLLRDESDRGCVLVASAYIEESLRELLKSNCKRLSDVSEKELKSIFKNSESQFYNFASCIRLARAIGLISQKHQKTLIKFGPQRNLFAHGTGKKQITEHWLGKFSTPLDDDIKTAYEHFSKLSIWKGQTEPRLKFIFWASLIHGMLVHKYNELTFSSSSSTVST